MQQIADRIVKTAGFEYFIIALIIGNGVLLGMETSPELVHDLMTGSTLDSDHILESRLRCCQTKALA